MQKLVRALCAGATLKMDKEKGKWGTWTRPCHACQVCSTLVPPLWDPGHTRKEKDLQPGGLPIVPGPIGTPTSPRRATSRARQPQQCAPTSTTTSMNSASGPPTKPSQPGCPSPTPSSTTHHVPCATCLSPSRTMIGTTSSTPSPKAP